MLDSPTWIALKFIEEFCLIRGLEEWLAMCLIYLELLLKDFFDKFFA